MVFGTFISFLAALINHRSSVLCHAGDLEALNSLACDISSFLVALFVFLPVERGVSERNTRPV